MMLTCIFLMKDMVTPPYAVLEFEFYTLVIFIGFFGEVFRGKWNGTEVAIKVFLEQDLTAENTEDFCNEISILRCCICFTDFVTLSFIQF